MPTLGFSYVLKLLSMNPKPQKTEARKRLTPLDGGYDFHSSFRRLAGQLLHQGVPLDDLLKVADSIKREPERASAKAALQWLAQWRELNPETIVQFEAVEFPGPTSLVDIRFQPDFAIVIESQIVAVHLWNTKRPKLSHQMTLAALSWLPKAYETVPIAPDDFAVLSLQDGKLIRLSDLPGAEAFGVTVFDDLGQMLEEVWDDIGSEIEPPGSHPPV